LDVDGAAVVLGADAVAEPDVLGLVVAVLGVEFAGDCGLLKSVHDSVRTVSPPALTLSVVDVTV
jgi:hypothetical protein